MTNEIVSFHEQAVALRRTTDLAGVLIQHHRRVAEMQRTYDAVAVCQDWTSQEQRIQVLTDALDQCNDFIDGELPTIRNVLELGMTAPSTPMDRVGMVAVLVRCYPN